jgi:hypothetical protein
MIFRKDDGKISTFGYIVVILTMAPIAIMIGIWAILARRWEDYWENITSNFR